MRKVIRGLAVALPAVLALSLAQTPGRADDKKNADPDLKFVQKAHMGNLAEVELGKLAQQNGVNPAVRDFGAGMVRDHTRLNEQVAQLAQQLNIQLPQKLDKKHQKEYDKFAKLQGADFDKAYAKGMVADHEKDLKEFKEEAKNGKNDMVKALAGNGVKVIEGHLRMAKKAAAAVGVNEEEQRRQR